MSKMIPIVSKLRHVREQWGLTTRDLAEILNTDQAQIVHWENRDCAPTVSNMLAWADALGCDLKVEVRK